MCPHDHLAAQQYQPIRLEPPDQLLHRPALSRWQAGLPDVAKCLSCRPCLPQLTASFGHPPPAGGPAQRGQVKCDQQPEAYARGTGALGHGVQAGHCHHGCHHCEARWKWYTPEQALEQAYCGSRASMPRCLLTCAHVRLPSCMCGANSPPALCLSLPPPGGQHPGRDQGGAGGAPGQAGWSWERRCVELWTVAVDHVQLR